MAAIWVPPTTVNWGELLKGSAEDAPKGLLGVTVPNAVAPREYSGVEGVPKLNPGEDGVPEPAHVSETTPKPVELTGAPKVDAPKEHSGVEGFPKPKPAEEGISEPADESETTPKLAVEGFPKPKPAEGGFPEPAHESETVPKPVEVTGTPKADAPFEDSEVERLPEPKKPPAHESEAEETPAEVAGAPKRGVGLSMDELEIVDVEPKPAPKPDLKPRGAPKDISEAMGAGLPKLSVKEDAGRFPVASSKTDAVGG